MPGIQHLVNYGSSDDHFCIKVKVFITFTPKVRYFDIAFDHISQWNSPHPLNQLEVYNYILNILYSIVLVCFGHLSAGCFLLFQLPLMLVV